jgi:hypothetical protein
MAEIFLIKEEFGFGIYDLEEECFIGFKKTSAYRSSYKTKQIWSIASHAKSAFKIHTGIDFNSQSRYEIRKK